MICNKKKMKKSVLTSLLLLFIGFSLHAQENKKVNYQAVARDQYGIVLANQQLKVKLSLVESTFQGDVHYAEIHEVRTDANGYFNLSIGAGELLMGDWNETPWSKESIWLEVAVEAKGEKDFRLLHRNELMAVPYAISTETADRIVAPRIEEREDQNIAWNTGGNYKTEPKVHFVGTRDLKSFFMKTNNETRIVIDSVGQMTIFADPKQNNQTDKKTVYRGELRDNGANILFPGPPNISVTLPSSAFNAFASNYFELKPGVLTPAEEANFMSLVQSKEVTLGELDPRNQEDNELAYPFRITGVDQGIFIQINESRSSKNNFVAFADPDGFQGAIEGQTRKELEGSFEFIWQNVIFSVDLAARIATSGADIVQTIGYATASGLSGVVFNFPAVGGFSAASVATGLLGALGVGHSVKKIVEIVDWNETQIERVGVYFGSGSADYAEYLKRMEGERKLIAGEIVGVKGGEISLNTQDADHVMVISSNPAFLGNLPSPEKLDLFEKVAFMGQVQVHVQGPVKIGDYILASGKNDGLGRALAKEDMQLADYPKIVGVAWEASQEDLPINTINVAVGLNKNDIYPHVQHLEDKVDGILAYLNEEGPLPSTSAGINPNAYLENISRVQNTDPQQVLDDEMFEQFLVNNGQIIENYFMLLEKEYQKRGKELRDNPVWSTLLDDPIGSIQEMRKNPALMQRWQYIDQKLPKKGE